MQHELVESMKQTLEDYRLSRGERKALKELFANLNHRELALLRSTMFDLARHATVDPETHGVLTWVEDMTKVLFPMGQQDDSTQSVARFSLQHDCSHQIQAMFKTCHTQVDICVFTVTDNRISRAISDAHRRGVKIRMITDNDKANDIGSDVQSLIAMGVHIRTDETPDHMHHKYAIFDSRKLLTGSYNWTRSAATVNEENFIITDDRSLVAAFRDHFQRLWSSYE